MTDQDCLFCKIVAGDIPADIIYESDAAIAFRDINPQAPTHVLVIPRRHVSTINDLEPGDAALVGELFLAARHIAAEEGIAEHGYRSVINCNRAAGQTVFHVHLHVLGGRDLDWPPG